MLEAISAMRAALMAPPPFPTSDSNLRGSMGIPSAIPEGGGVDW